MISNGTKCDYTNTIDYPFPSERDFLEHNLRTGLFMWPLFQSGLRSFKFAEVPVREMNHQRWITSLWFHVAIRKGSKVR